MYFLNSKVEPTNRKGKIMNEIKEWSICIAIALALSFVIQNYAIAQVKVEDVSMQKTFFDGDRLIENKLAYHFSEPERGDIVIIHGPEHTNRLIKRIIGLPGDTIEYRDGYVYLNGEKLEEHYTNGESRPKREQYPLLVPANTVYVLGDNRERSEDSRTIGVIRFNSLEGKVIFQLYPFGNGKIE